MQQDELTGSLGRVDRGCLLASQPTCSFQVTSRTGDTKRPKASSNKCPESRSVGIYQMIIKVQEIPRPRNDAVVEIIARPCLL